MNAVHKISLLAAVLATVATQALAAGSTEVSYLHPEKFTDAGFGAFERNRTLRSLTEHFEVLAKRLPDGQILRVEVLNIDLAGEIWPRTPSEVRVLRGRADWPHMSLRYTVLDGSGTIKAGETHLADMNYLFNLRGDHRHGDLPYEKRMLDRWFNEQIVVAAP